MPKNFKKVEDVLYRKIFNHAKGGISIVSLKGEWVKVNQSLVQLLGYPEEELYKNVPPMLTGKSSTDHPRVQRLVHESLGHMPELLTLYNRH